MPARSGYAWRGQAPALQQQPADSKRSRPNPVYRKRLTMHLNACSETDRMPREWLTPSCFGLPEQCQLFAIDRGGRFAFFLGGTLFLSDRH